MRNSKKLKKKKKKIKKSKKQKQCDTKANLSASQLILSLSLSLLKSPTCLEKTHFRVQGRERRAAFLFCFSFSSSLCFSFYRQTQKAILHSGTYLFLNLSVFKKKFFWCCCLMGMSYICFMGTICLVLDKRVCFCFYFCLVTEYMGLLGYSLIW